MSKPSDIVTIALAEVGYREKASNAALDDKTANAGAANWTKYARDLAAAGYYNGNKNGYAWCDVFVDWCFFKAYGAVEGQRIQCQTGPLGAGCIYSAQYYQQKGRYDRNPKVGDQVFFQSGGQIGHTGIVVEVTDSTIVTVEGNSSDQVKRNTRSYGFPNGYVVPTAETQVLAAETVLHPRVLHRQTKRSFRVVYQVDTIDHIRRQQHRQHVVQFRHGGMVQHYRRIHFHALITLTSLFTPNLMMLEGLLLQGSFWR